MTYVIRKGDDKRLLIHWFSSSIQSCCLSTFTAPVRWPALSLASASTSFLIETPASTTARFFALIASFRSRSSALNRVSIARSSCRRRSALLCSACECECALSATRGSAVPENGRVRPSPLRLVRERLELLTHFVESYRGICERLVRRGDFCLEFLCAVKTRLSAMEIVRG